MSLFIRKAITFFSNKQNNILNYKKLDFKKSIRIKNCPKTEIENIILTTYFTTKKDPQRGVPTEKNNFSYIEDFYKSVLENNLYAVIFYDDLDEEFIRKYTCKNISFIQCTLGNYSLNDERFYIYYEFLKNNKKIKKIIFCDVNDVTLEKRTVFEFIKKNKFYIGRDEDGLIYRNHWLKNKVHILPEELQKKIPKSFYYMPVVNAGVIAGDSTRIMEFLETITTLFDRINNDENNNMACTNIVFYDLYWKEYMNSLKFKILSFRGKDFYIKLETKRQIKNKYFNIGYPLTTRFKKFENGTKAYIKHK